MIKGNIFSTKKGWSHILKTLTQLFFLFSFFWIFRIIIDFDIKINLIETILNDPYYYMLIQKSTIKKSYRKLPLPLASTILFQKLLAEIWNVFLYEKTCWKSHARFCRLFFKLLYIVATRYPISSLRFFFDTCVEVWNQN